MPITWREITMKEAKIGNIKRMAMVSFGTPLLVRNVKNASIHSG